MKWLNLTLDIQERLNIDIATRDINNRSPEEIEAIFNQLMTNNALQSKAIEQLTTQLFQQEAKNHESRS